MRAYKALIRQPVLAALQSAANIRLFPLSPPPLDDVRNQSRSERHGRRSVGRRWRHPLLANGQEEKADRRRRDRGTPSLGRNHFPENNKTLMSFLALNPLAWLLRRRAVNVLDLDSLPIAACLFGRRLSRARPHPALLSSPAHFPISFPPAVPPTASVTSSVRPSASYAALHSKLLSSPPSARDSPARIPFRFRSSGGECRGRRVERYNTTILISLNI